MALKYIYPTLFRLINPGFRFLLWAVLIGSLPQEIYADNSRRYGLWVEVEGNNRPFDNKEGFAEFKEFTEKSSFTDLYCQIYRGGRSWFHSTLADETPYKQSKSAGVDPLKDTIAFAHARGKRVHAWVNVFRVAKNPDAPIVKAIGPEAVLMDSHGTSLLSYSKDGKPPGIAERYFQLGTPALWLDAGNKRVRDYLVSTLRELLEQYPELDGLHLDMVRFPFAMRKRRGGGFRAGLEYGYSNAMIEDFYEQMAERYEKEGKMPNEKEWASWRKDQVTEFVHAVKAMIKEVNPKVELSAAVVAWPTRAQKYAMQDWERWVREGTLDYVVPMSYTRNSSAVKDHTINAMKQAKHSKGRVMMGLGAWLMLKSPERVVEQTRFSLEGGADGVVLFSYSNMLNQRGRLMANSVGDEIF